jgi:hypothetical protein
LSSFLLAPRVVSRNGEGRSRWEAVREVALKNRRGARRVVFLPSNYAGIGKAVGVTLVQGTVGDA